MILTTTIAAISTPRGKGGVAMIRISGKDAFAVADRITRPKNGKKLSDNAPRISVYADLVSADGETILDDGLVTLFRAPRSRTGEDVAEICCHGGEVVSALILESALRAGAVMAGPGEFSRRALINGKLTLTAAEGIADLLDAKTEAAVLLSSGTARGMLSEKLDSLSKRLLAAAASLWAYLDYPEEDLQSFSDDALCAELSLIRDTADRLADSFRTGKAITGGVNTMIVGKPNVGKSTFFNAFLGEDRAIVTEIPGTTRDVIGSEAKAGRVLLELFDTAGIRRSSDDPIENIGMEKVKEGLKEAELVFALFDSSRPFDEDDAGILAMLENCGAKILPILTKCDLPEVFDAARIASLGEPVRVAAKEKKDWSDLIALVESAFISDESALREGAVLTNLRQKIHLVNLSERMREAAEHIRAGQKDLASLDLENAVSELNEVDGRGAAEQILNEVFSRFCVGK